MFGSFGTSAARFAKQGAVGAAMGGLYIGGLAKRSANGITAMGGAAGAAWGAVSNDTSMVGGAAMGAIGARYGRAGVRGASKLSGAYGRRGLPVGNAAGRGLMYGQGVGRGLYRQGKGDFNRMLSQGRRASSYFGARYGSNKSVS